MKLLLLETSSRRYSLALGEAGRVSRYRNVRSERVLSSTLIPEIQKLLKKSGWELTDIDGFGVGLGPGSFTGLRIGVATVKAFAAALDKPVIGISSLDILAQGVVTQSREQICVLTDARRGMVYAGLYVVKAGRLKRQGKYLLTPLAEVLKDLRGEVLFVGDGLRVYRQTIEASPAGKGHGKKFTPVFADDACAEPQARNLLPLVGPLFESKRYDDVDRLVPLYLYSADCQVRREQ